MAEQKAKTEEKKDILILYEKKDAQMWTDFIQESIRECPKNLSIEVKDLQSDIDEVKSLSASFSMVLVIVSNAMLKTMESAANVLNPILQGHSCVSVIKLYLEETKYTKMTQFYETAKNWKEFSVASTDNANNVQTLISDIINILQNLHVPKKPVKPSPRKSRIQSICPEYIRQGGEMMTLVLRTKVSDGQTVQVSVGDNENLIDTNQLNPFCFTFKAPAHKAGKADFRLFIDGRKIAKWPVHYSSMTRFAYTCPEYLCQLIGLNPDDKTGLDKELTNIFNNSAPQDGSLQSMLTPKVFQSTSTGGVEGCGELPTLLHFACKFDLNDLAVAIINTPGSHVAINMDNERGCNPLDLAKENNNEELVNYLEAFVEMHDYVTDIEDLYEKMSGGKKLEPYMNTGAEGGVPRSGYLSMGRQSVEEAYTTARVPSLDYEITDTPIQMPGGPEEVKEEDDVPPEVPRRRSKKKQPEPPEQPTDMSDLREQSKPDDFPEFAPIPEDDFFAGPGALSPGSMGSERLEELFEYAEAFKKGDFNLNDIERLYRAWHERNRDTASPSIKERKKQLDELRNTYQSIVSVQKGRKKSMLPWKKKGKQPELNIQHHVQPNKYESWSVMSGATTLKRYRESTISVTSTTSSSSSSSQDSALGRVPETSSESDTSDTEAPAVPLRVRSDSRKSEEKKANRQSWGEQFLNIVKNKPNSRLPKPPPTNPNYVSYRLPSTPEVPPRIQSSSPSRHLQK